MGLFSKKQKLTQATTESIESFDITNFMEYNGKLEVLSQFIRDAENAKNIEAEKKSLEAFLTTYNQYKQILTKEGQNWENELCSMWEHCQNNENLVFSFIAMYQERLDHLNKHGEEEKAKIAEWRRAMNGIDKKIIDVIKNNDGILQKDIYAHFNPIIKNDLQSHLYLLAKEGKIKRVKQGSTYALHI